MLNQLLVSLLVVRSVVSQQQWVTIFKCDGDGQTDNRWPTNFGRRGWENLNGMTLQDFAKTASKLRICTTGNADDCVTTKGDNVALKNLQNGKKNLQPIGWDKFSHGLTCDQNCVNEYWEGPEHLKKHLWWDCPASQDEMVFHACNNVNGLHISIDKGHCEWDWETSDRLEIQLLVPSDWVTVFTCMGDGKTDDRTVEDDWQALANRSSAVRICTWGSDTDCVESSGTALFNLQSGMKLLQEKGKTFCDIDCVKEEWSGPDEQLERLKWQCGIGEWKMFYHACGNTNGLHVAQDKDDGGYCEWRWGISTKIDIQLLVDLPTDHPTATPTPAPTGEPTTAKPTFMPTTSFPTSVPTKTPTSGPTVEPMRFEEYKALCALSIDSKDACKGLGCKYKKKKDKAKCIAKPGKKTKCWKVKDQDVCSRLGCEFHLERGCIGRPENLFDN